MGARQSLARLELRGCDQYNTLLICKTGQLLAMTEQDATAYGAYPSWRNKSFLSGTRTFFRCGYEVCCYFIHDANRPIFCFRPPACRADSTSLRFVSYTILTYHIDNAVDVGGGCVNSEDLQKPLQPCTSFVPQRIFCHGVYSSGVCGVGVVVAVSIIVLS